MAPGIGIVEAHAYQRVRVSARNRDVDVRTARRKEIASDLTIASAGRFLFVRGHSPRKLLLSVSTPAEMVTNALAKLQSLRGII